MWISFILFCLASAVTAQDDSFAVNADVGIHRSLLQEDSESPVEYDEPKEEGVEQVHEEPVVVLKGLAEPGEYKLGPKLFFDSKDFLMRLSAPIRVTVFSNTEGEESRKLSTVDLDGEAVSVKGSMITEDSFKVNLDWKSQNFGNDFKITTIQIHMYFIKTKDEYYMNKLEVVGLTINNQQMLSNELRVQTKHGYKVAAPLGSSFCCYDPGMFEPQNVGGGLNPFRVGVTFPGMQLQVFKLGQRIRFGPEWACDSMMTIGLWVGLLVTLLFAAVCYWGFSMLANIQTMDRFDDPRGKSIHVPQTD